MNWSEYYPEGKNSFAGAFIRSGGNYRKWLVEIRKHAQPQEPVTLADIEPIPGHYEEATDGYRTWHEWVPDSRTR